MRGIMAESALGKLARLAHVPGYTGQGWHTNETMLVVKWIFSHDDVLRRILELARQHPHNEHTVADTLHEQLVPRSELVKILGQGGEPAKVDWLEIAHEIIERRNDPTGLAALPGVSEFPGRKKIRIAQTPEQSRSMFSAHRIDDTVRQLSHALERCDALASASGSKDRSYHSAHLTNHLSACLDQMHAFTGNLRRNYPAEAAELDAVKQTVGLAKSLSPAAKTATTAHLTETVLHELTHGKRHSLLMMKADPARLWEFNYDHAQKHVHGAHEHAVKLMQHLLDNYPEEARWLRMLGKLSSPEQPDRAHREYVRAAAGQDKMTKPQANYRAASIEGHTCHTCVNRTNGTCRLVAGTVDRQSVCDSYEAMAELAAPAAWPAGKAYAKSMLSPPRDAPAVVSAPGTGPPQYLYGQLRQAPSQTVSPSPPLPPGVSLPSPKELRAFAKQLGKMQDDDENHHLRAAQMHLESAAEKIPNNAVSALASLRSAQMAIQDEWRERISRNQPRIAYVFSENTPPAEQSSQQQAWARAQSQIGQMQGAASRIAEFIDRVRRAYFGRMGMENQTAGGGLAGQPNARL